MDIIVIDQILTCSSDKPDTCPRITQGISRTIIMHRTPVSVNSIAVASVNQNAGIFVLIYFAVVTDRVIERFGQNSDSVSVPIQFAALNDILFSGKYENP